MRLDKFLSVTATATRSEAGKAARAGRILVNGIACKNASAHIDPEKCIGCGLCAKNCASEAIVEVKN